MSTRSKPLFRSTARPGYSREVSSASGRVFARKLVREVEVRFTPIPCAVSTREGIVHARAGDAIITGAAGEHWRVSGARFAEKYNPVPPTVAGSDGRYASRPNRIMAVQLREPFDVVLADGISRLSGEADDWLVDYGDGSLGIVANDIFAKTYEIIL